jgi:hypothetical protein
MIEINRDKDGISMRGHAQDEWIAATNWSNYASQIVGV